MGSSNYDIVIPSVNLTVRYWSRGPIEIVSFQIQNVPFLVDFPIKNYDFPMNNDEFPIKKDGH